MADPYIDREADLDHIQRVLIGAVRKLREGMDEGPMGPPVTLTTEEACLLWRTLDLSNPKLVEMSNGG